VCSSDLKRYIAASRTDHCPEDGTCWEHCPFGHTAADWND
jgi:NAD-dependent dihydropyrimidine dehydrogenase PreA subunit